jgi:hypothetical protein
MGFRTPKKATTMYAETFEKFQHSTRIIHKSHTVMFIYRPYTALIAYLSSSDNILKITSHLENMLVLQTELFCLNICELNPYRLSVISVP